MKLMKKLLIASAIGMAFAGQAQALTTGTGVNNGSLYLAVWDNSTAGTYSYVQDLNQTIDSFQPSGATAGANLSFNTSFLGSFTGLTSDLRWNVVSYDSSAANFSTNIRRAAVTTQVGTTNAGGITNNALQVVTNNIGTAATNLNCATALTGCSSTSTFLKGATYGNTLGYAGLSTSQSLGAALEMMFLAGVGTNPGAATAAAYDFYDNAYGRAVWSLTSAGQLTYSIAGAPVSEVPVPAALWLFGSGLLGLVGIGRRKSVAAA